MEDTFRVRVDKTFNSLSSSSPSSPSSSSQTLTPSLWCLTDEEIQKRQWTREPDASVPVDDDDDDDDNEDFLNSNVDKFFFAAAAAAAKGSNSNASHSTNPNPNLNELDSRKELVEDLQDLDDEDNDDGHGGESSGAKSEVNECREVVCGQEDDELLDVKKSIGMDCTLDYEEEEDAYDKVAVGTEKVGPRLYMSDVTDYTSDITTYDELPNTFKEAPRDPRANHLAAKLRLKEDAETARSFNSLHVSDQTEGYASSALNIAPEDGNLPKSILKRKDDQMDSKSGKRVRFDPICQTNDSTSDGDKNILSEASNVDSTLVPDHVRHPLRYTHYTFDTSSDMNEESNRQAYMDFLNMVKKSKPEPEEVPADLTKPVKFNPKKKAVDASGTTSNMGDSTMEEPVQKKSCSLSIAAGNTEEYEASEMEVDVHEPAAFKVGSERRTARKYRSKVTVASDEPDS